MKLNFIIPILILLFISSCKDKGCTDPTAINYNSTADEDDGSCIKCTLQLDSSNSLFSEVIDDDSLSPYYGHHVATFYVRQYKNTYGYSDCGTGSCYFLVYAQNLITDSISMSYAAQVGGGIQFFHSNNVTVPPLQYMKTDSILSTTITNPCGLMSSSSFSITPGSIIYH